jgi:hypothetical protein
MTLPNSLQYQRGAVQIDREDCLRRCLAGGDAGSVDDAGDVTERRGGFDERVHRPARRHVDDHGAHLESCIAQYLGRCVGVLKAQVSQQDILTGAHPPRDRLANRPRSNDNNDITHDDALS